MKKQSRIRLAGKHSDVVVLVDPEDYDKLASRSWKLSNSGYAFRTPNKSIYMHRVIVDCPPGMTVDHINGDRLDNRKSNLRICTLQENNYSKAGNHKNNRISKYKGVSLHRATGLWRARIRVNKKEILLGYHKSQENAAKAYDTAAVKYHKEFAIINGVL